MTHKPGFYKYQRNIMMSTRIKKFQTIKTFITGLQILRNHIIFLLQQLGKIQNGIEFEILF